jgi:uncharacterized protein (DUF2141 family)
MRRRIGARALFGALALSSLALAALTLPARGQIAGGLGDPVDTTRRLIVTVHTRNDRGRVYCGLWRGREGYPSERRRAVGQARDRALSRQRGVCVFEDVSPGEYAVAVFHDENANNDLDRNFLGIPSEGTGASNGAHNPFGPPGYDDARFLCPDTRVHRIAIHVRY